MKQKTLLILTSLSFLLSMTFLAGCSEQDSLVPDEKPIDSGDNGEELAYPEDAVIIDFEIPYPEMHDYSIEVEEKDKQTWGRKDQLLLYLPSEDGNENIQIVVTNYNGDWTIQEDTLEKYQSILEEGGEGYVLYFGRRIQNSNFAAEIPTDSIINYLVLKAPICFSYNSYADEVIVESTDYGDYYWTALTHEELKVMPVAEQRLMGPGYKTKFLTGLRYDKKIRDLTPIYQEINPSTANVKAIYYEGNWCKFYYVASCKRTNYYSEDDDIGGKSDYGTWIENWNAKYDNPSIPHPIITVEGHEYRMHDIWYATVVGFNNSNKDFIAQNESKLNHKPFRYVNLEVGGLPNTEERTSFINNFTRFVLSFNETRRMMLSDFIKYMKNKPTYSAEKVLEEYSNWCVENGIPAFVSSTFDKWHYSQEKLALSSTPPEGLRKSNWMSFLDDRTPVSQLVIPGCHDQATHTMTRFNEWANFVMLRWGKCQDKGIGEAFDLGARWFDMRLSFKSQGEYTFRHGPIRLKAISDYMKEYMVNKGQLGKETIFFEVDRENRDGVEREMTKEEIQGSLAEFLKWVVYALGEDIFAGFTPETPIGELRGKVCLITHRDEMSEWLLGQGIPHCLMKDHHSFIVKNDVFYMKDDDGSFSSYTYPIYTQSEYDADAEDKWEFIKRGVDGKDGYNAYLNTATKPSIAFQNCNANIKNIKETVTKYNPIKGKNPSYIAEYNNPRINDNFIGCSDNSLKNPLAIAPGFWGFDFWGVEDWEELVPVPGPLIPAIPVPVPTVLFVLRINDTHGVAITSVVPLSNFYYYDNKTGQKKWNVKTWNAFD